MLNRLKLENFKAWREADSFASLGGNSPTWVVSLARLGPARP